MRAGPGNPKKIKWEEKVKRKIVLIPLALLLATSIVAMGCPPVEVEPPVPEVPEPVVFEWTMQTTWPAGFLLHFWAVDLAERVERWPASNRGASCRYHS